ncbi:fec operon regulator FecR [Pedobacter glucosidilyticus]|nr:FecR family protein [Pedobacter glucosidilyticus]KHJ38935.1 fec operon regulator FecR [Pedobacter glucosidilyticus]
MKFKALYRKFLSNTITKLELEKLMDHFKNESEASLKHEIKEAFVSNQNQTEFTDEQHLERLRLQIINKIKEEQVVAQKNQRFIIPTYLRVAAVLVLISVAAYLFYPKNLPINPIKPGKNIALLEINGKKILLDDKRESEIYRQTGISIIHHKNGSITYHINEGADSTEIVALQTIKTPRGGQYKITLSDGTKVMLNSESRLYFPAGFRGNTRSIKLDGEAYFEVAHQAKRPFIVDINGMQVKVLGTKFNVSNYPEDKGIKTTLLEGSVAIDYPGNNKTNLLKPNQQALFNKGGLTIADVDTEESAAWTNNLFLFNNVPFDVVMQKLARWYNIEVDYDSLPERNLYVKINRNVDMQKVLEMISLTTDVKFKLEGRKLSIEQ